MFAGAAITPFPAPRKPSTVHPNPASRPTVRCIDVDGPEKVRQYLDDLDIKHLELYNDEKMRLNFALDAFGLPVTLLIDEEGREIGRLVGTAEWDDPEIKKFLAGLQR